MKSVLLSMLPCFPVCAGAALGRNRSRSLGHTSERRTLHFSRSHPDLSSAAPAAHAPAITVLGREARRRSERRRNTVSEDGAALPRSPPGVGHASCGGWALEPCVGYIPIMDLHVGLRM